MTKMPRSWEDAVEWLKSHPKYKELSRQCYFDDPLVVAAERFRRSDEWRETLDLLGGDVRGKSVLEIGAGRGVASYAFSVSGAVVVAFEPDPSEKVGIGAIKSLSKESGERISIVRCFGESMPFGDENFDIVYGRAVLHHAKNMKLLCNEVDRVLKPGGQFLIAREHVISHENDLDVFLRRHPLHHMYGGENAYFLSEYISAITMRTMKIKSLLGPYDSVVNYAPLSREELNDVLMPRLKRLTGSVLAKNLLRIKGVESFVRKMLSLSCNEPGRHYSFLAKKVL